MTLLLGVWADKPVRAAPFELCQATGRVNLLVNPGFEFGEGLLVISNWWRGGSGARETTNGFGFTGAAMREGEYALKGWDTDLNCFQSNLLVAAGSTYEAEGWFFHSSTADVISPTTNSTRMFMVVEWFDELHNAIALHVSSNHNGTTPADSWQPLHLTAVAPPGSATATFHVQTDSDTGAGSIFADAMFFGEPIGPVPSWEGPVLVDGTTTSGWNVVVDPGATGSMRSVAGPFGQAAQLNWNLGTANWVRAEYDFDAPRDLFQADVIGVTLRGGGPTEAVNRVAFMLISTNGGLARYDFGFKDNSVNQVDRWLVNMTLSTGLWHSVNPQPYDASNAFRFVVLVERPAPGEGGGAGQFSVDAVQWDRAADWPRPSAYEHQAPAEPVAASNAIAYLVSKQYPSGLLTSWKEEAPPLAWLYDQALALIALTRAGSRLNLQATDAVALAADALAEKLVAEQLPDGRWPRSWDPITGTAIVTDFWPGDQAWGVIALSVYAQRTGNTAALAAAEKGAAWVASLMDGDGKVHGSTEATLDAWWAMMLTQRFADADVIADYLLNNPAAWDASMRYWGAGYNDPLIVMDTATWGADFARHPRINQPQRGLDALGVAARALLASSDDRTLCGFGVLGPLTVMNEYTAQYVAAGGEHAAEVLETLLVQQRGDGGMPGASDNWLSDALGWATTWTGLAPTAWLYFALTGSPFPFEYLSTCDGAVAYGGPQQGTVTVCATNHTTTAVTTITVPGAYGLAGLPVGSNYWLSAFLDSNSNGVPDQGEARGTWAGNPFLLTNLTAGLNLVLADPDDDNDGLPDYWEYLYFDHPTNVFREADSDGDGSSNEEEFSSDTNPTNGLSVFTNRIVGFTGYASGRVRTAAGTTNSRLYDLCWRSNFSEATTWTVVQTVTGTGMALEFSVTNSHPQSFYHLRTRLP